MSYIYFEETTPNPKTKVWNVRNKQDDTLLGQIRWFSRWRCYGFYSGQDMIFEKVCLRDIATFCERETFVHRNLKRAEKK